MGSPSHSASNSSASLFLSISDNDELLSSLDPSSPQSLFPLLIQDMPINFNELNTNHASTPLLSPSLASHLSPNPISSQSLQFSPHHIYPQFSTDLPSNHPTFQKSSPNLSSNKSLISFPATAGRPKRDWLSSLSQSSPSFSLSAPVPTSIPSSAPSCFGHQHSLIAYSHLQSTCEKSALQTSSSTNKLRSCDTPHIAPCLSHVTNTMQSQQPAGQGGSGKLHNDDDDFLPKLCGSVGGANAYTGLRLSHVIAVMQMKPPDSHLSSSGNTILNSALNNSNSCSNSETPHISTIDEVKWTNPALIQSCHVKAPAKAVVNADELLQRSCTNVHLAGSMAKSTQGESKKNKKTGKPESVSSMDEIAILSGILQSTRKTEGFGSIGDPARKREVHIYSERERRRGMTHLYTTLHSLLPNRKFKADRCSVLAETMEYIQSLLEKLDELDKQKVDVIASMQQVNNTKPAASTASIKSTEITTQCDKGISSSVYDDSNAAKSSKVLIKCGLEEDMSAKNRSSSSTRVANCSNVEMDSTNHANASTCKYIKGQGNASFSENRTDMSMSHQSAEAQEPSKRALGGSLEDSSGNFGEKLDGNAENKCDSEKINDADIGCDDDEENGDESVVGSQGGKGEVGVSMFGEDAFITVRTLKKRGAWSGVLEVLQQLGIHILNVTLSASPDSDHHCIHAKVPSGCKLNSCVLKQSLKAFVGDHKQSLKAFVGDHKWDD